MKRASYREAVAFAANFDTDVTEVEDLSGLLTVGLIATIFDVDCSRVATDVVCARAKAQNEGQP